MKKQIEASDRVEILNGKYKGEIGVVDFKLKGQYDVKLADGTMRYLGIDDIKIAPSSK